MVNLTADFLLQAKDTAKKAVLAIRPRLVEAYGAIEHNHKADESVVTELDLWAEQQLKDSLRVLNTGIGFLGEEHGQEGNKTTRWLVDPIDGTEHFVRGIPQCTNMMTLVDGKEVLLSVIYNFITGEFYWAAKAQGAWCNDQKLSISQRGMKQALIDVGTDISEDDSLKLMQSVRREASNVTRFMASGYVASLLASGRIEGRVTFNSKGGPWDYSPMGIFIPESGGKVANLGKGTYDFENHNVISGSPAIHDRLQEILGAFVR